MSEKDPPKTRLDRRIDAALASWPLRGLEESAWNDMADRVEDRLASASAPGRGSAEDDVLKAPLPATPHEMQESASLAKELGQEGPRAAPSYRPSRAPAPGERSMSSLPPSERDRDRRSLRDLAKLAASPSLTPGPPQSKESLTPRPFGTPGDSGDSGIVDLKKMAELNPGFQPGYPGRPQGTATPPPPPPFASTRPTPAIAPPPFPPASGGAQYSAPPPFPLASPMPASALGDDVGPYGRKKRRGLAWTVGIGVVLAAAAAAVLVLRSQPTLLMAFRTPPPPPPVATAAPPPPSDPAASAAPPPPATPPPEAVAKVDTPAPAEPAAAEPSHASPSNPSSAAQKGVAAASAPSPSPNSRKGGGAVAKAAPPVNPALVAKNVPASAPQSGSLNDALRQAAGPMDAPAAGGGGSAPAPVDMGSNVPQKPSQGAIASGVGSSLTQARACLSSDNPISHANITFDSSGSVTNVSITGYAAGKPAEGCIKAALKRARVPAFAQPTYTTGVTVRPTG